MNQNAEKSAEIPNENRLWGAFCQSQEDADFYVTWLGLIALRIARTQRNRPLEPRPLEFPVSVKEALLQAQWPPHGLNGF